MKTKKVTIISACNYYSQIKNLLIDAYNEESNKSSKEEISYKRRSMPFIATFKLGAKRFGYKKLGLVNLKGQLSTIIVELEYNESEEELLVNSVMYIALQRIINNQDFQYIAKFIIEDENGVFISGNTEVEPKVAENNEED